MAGIKTEVKYVVTRVGSLKVVYSSKYNSKRVRAFHQSNSHKVYSLAKIQGTPLLAELHKANAMVETKAVRRMNEPKVVQTATKVVATEQLTDGQVITLANGDIVKVSLEVITKKVTKLEVNKKYRLQYCGEHCHTKAVNGTDYSHRIGELVYTYVGKINIGVGERHIFYSESEGAYSMWSTKSLKFVVGEVN